MQKSRVNRVLIQLVRDLEGVTFHDLYEEYPEFDIDVKREQQLLANHDIIIFHHPLFWFSIPSILKEWKDLVLEHGWAFGHEGTALRGKKIFCAITTGGSESAYQKDGFNRFTIREFLVPIEQTFRMCGMDYLPPFAVHGTHGITSSEIEKHAEDYRRTIEAFRDDRIDLDIAKQHPRLNTNLDETITRNTRPLDAR
jgi:glutathione-regulated potassium-efflux system ancillary protein KefG